MYNFKGKKEIFRFEGTFVKKAIFMFERSCDELSFMASGGSILGNLAFGPIRNIGKIIERKINNPYLKIVLQNGTRYLNLAD